MMGKCRLELGDERLRISAVRRDRNACEQHRHLDGGWARRLGDPEWRFGQSLAAACKHQRQERSPEIA